MSPHLSRKRNLMPAKATRSSTTRRSRFSLWLRWKAISAGHTQGSGRVAAPQRTPSTGDPVQPRVSCPAPLTRAAQDPEKGDMGETPPTTLVPPSRTCPSCTPCPSYLMCPNTGAGGRTCLCLCLQGHSLPGLCQRTSKQDGSCRAGPHRGIPSSCSVTSERRAVSQGGGVRWHHGTGTVQPGPGQAPEATPLWTEER